MYVQCRVLCAFLMCAVCSLQYLVYNFLCIDAIYLYMLYTYCAAKLNDTPHSTINNPVPCAVCNVFLLCAVCGVPSTVSSVQCLVHSVQYTCKYSVQCSSLHKPPVTQSPLALRCSIILVFVILVLAILVFVIIVFTILVFVFHLLRSNI